MRQESQITADRKKIMPQDHHRPTYHFMPTNGWMNDPNGPITWHDGIHHLFYQHNPNGGWHEQMHWGHATTRDLVHWQHKPIALAPDKHFDKDGIYSGSAINADGTPMIFYTGIRPELQCIATSDESLNQWHKFPKPIVQERPEGLELDGFRDPTLWIDPDTELWNMGIGSGIIGQGGIVLKYEAPDGLYGEWRYSGILLQDEPALATNCECPDYFKINDTWAMIASPQSDNPRRGSGTIWLTGKHENGKFIPQKQGLLDASPLYYAPKSFNHIDGRRIVWGWIREGRSVARERNLQWAGVMSLPREIHIDANGIITTIPCPEVKLLRKDTLFETQNSQLYAGESRLITNSGANIEIEALFERGNANSVELQILANPDGSERTTIAYNWQTNTLTLDQSLSTLNKDPEINRSIYTAGQNPDLPNRNGHFNLKPDEPLELRVFIDHSVIEVFANQRATITGRAYPTKTNSTSARILPRGGHINIKNLKTWHTQNTPK